MSCGFEKTGITEEEKTLGNQSQIPVAKIGDFGNKTYKLAEGLSESEASQQGLERGVYKIVATIPYEGVGNAIRNVEKSINQNEEFKRIRFDKIDIVPTDKEMNGEKVGKLTIVAEVIDNPVWLPAVIYGASAIGTLTAGWFFVDEVNEFSQESILPIGTLVLAGLGIYLTLKFK